MFQRLYLFLCFVRAPFKLALLNWMPLNKLKQKNKKQKKRVTLAVGLPYLLVNRALVARAMFLKAAVLLLKGLGHAILGNFVKFCQL